MGGRDPCGIAQPLKLARLPFSATDSRIHNYPPRWNGARSQARVPRRLSLYP